MSKKKKENEIIEKTEKSDKLTEPDHINENEVEGNNLPMDITDLKYNIVFEDSVKNMISEVGFDEMYGARPLKRAIQDRIEDFISEEVIKGTIVENGTYIITFQEEKVVLKEQESLEVKPKKGRKKKTD